MTVRIVDRRQDSRNKSSINRSRFIRRFKGQIRKAVADAIAKRGIRDLENGEKIGIPGRDISEPHFQHGQGGVRESVHPGNDRFQSGDEMDRPPGGQGLGSGKASQDGEGIDDFVFTLTRDEFLDIFFDELALPNLVKRQLARIDEYKRVRAGYTQTGVATNINLVRTMRGAAGRRVAVGGPYATRLRSLQAELEQALDEMPADEAEIERLNREIVHLKARREAIPFIDPFDLRYSNRIRVPEPSTQAVMFCVMDVSGSMDEAKKQMAKRFFMLLYLFLNRNYEHIEVVFIRHHTVAEEVDEDNFFHSRETGGTIVSSALKLMRDIITERYASSAWNIYCAQASDGDNWNDDSPLCREMLAESILPMVQYFAYIEIADSEPQNLWLEYEELAGAYPGLFAMQRITAVSDIYPVFRELFRKRLV
ncbi:YeaH/YhbH family protein [Ferribacterium limneticum]|uniref:YeaH/YhbH family protein n=1 Tax=Ferribacterium limneticum TaxID=76259 RepID=UPI001CF81262|nr:YeaH/YhbH family protein [Ferribacterium limneticum]UCV23202.1 YeaH/YhbH family protein [Ferribacterium limneticum]